MMNMFDFGTIKSAKTGVLGRILTTSDDINIGSLKTFLGTQARIEAVAEGKFVVPNLWFSRFDIGKCAQSELHGSRPFHSGESVI